MCANKGAQIAELFTKVIATTKCFDHNLRKVKVISCGSGRLLTEFQVGPEHLNQRGTLHGGFIAHLVDAVSTYALTANDNIETRGVSIDLSVSYFTAAREGDEIEVEAITKKLGKKIAFLEVEVRNKGLKMDEMEQLLSCCECRKTRIGEWGDVFCGRRACYHYITKTLADKEYGKDVNLNPRMTHLHSSNTNYTSERDFDEQLIF